ncbi:MAG: hypothetical protein LBK56_09815 [Gracilibacteraceae bacterium]|jgi:hypothetical protein|nr:hypothetical protein [Gracilibacteraceae bacterium]
MTGKQAIRPSEQAGGFTHKVGSTAYRVNVYYGTPEAEPLEEKILRMMKNELNAGARYGKMAMPQADALPAKLRFAGRTDRLPERDLA